MTARLGDLSPTEISRRLGEAGIDLPTGGFTCRLRSRIPAVAENIALLYADFPVREAGGFADFHVTLEQPRGPRRWWRPQVMFRFDDHVPFKPLPYSQAYPMFEWGLNWCISNHAHHRLVLHAAVLERGGRALILPAPPGSGKSTLCAALAGSGWRLLSDELGLIDPAVGRITGPARPINLKNRSIDVLRERLPGATFSRPFHDTGKGTVALMRPPPESVRRAGEAAEPAWIISVRYEAGAATRFAPVDRGAMFMRVAGCTFNYTVLGRLGFRVLGRLIDTSDCYELVYSRLDEALGQIERLEPPRRAVSAA